MNLFRFVKLLLQNYRWVLFVPMLLAGIVYYSTMDEPKMYSSTTSIYTGFASGYDVDMRQGLGNRFLIQSVFENVLTIMKSKEVKEEVALKLLSQHLLQDTAQTTVLSKNSLLEMHNLISEEIRQELIVKGDFDKTYIKVREYYAKDYSNKIYKILNSQGNYYSFGTLTGLSFKRIKSSDIVQIDFSTNDPGICYHTVAFFSEAFIRKYRGVKVSETNDIVEYFERQMQRAQGKLDQLEGDLLAYRSSNNILNYGEQTRAIAQRRQEMEGLIYNERMRLGAAEKTVEYTQKQLDIHFQILSKNTSIVEKRNRLEKIASSLAMFRTFADTKKDTIDQLSQQMAALKASMEKDLDEIFSASATTSGIKSGDLLKKWFDNIVLVGESKARLKVYDLRSEDFKRLYRTLAPVGSNLTKIEREVAVAEGEYLRILEALNLAKLRQQNIALSTKLKIVDAPKYPGKPDPSKRKLLIIVGFLVGLILIISILVLLEFLDRSIRQPVRLMQLTGLKLAAVFPFFPKKVHKKILYDQIEESLSLRLVEYIHAQIEGNTSKPKIIAITSMLETEGKSFVASKLSNCLVSMGKTVTIFAPEKPEGENDAEENVQFYDSNQLLLKANSNKEIIGKNNSSDYSIIEYPFFYSYKTPYALLREVDASIIVVRSSRAWSKADRTLLDNMKEILPSPPLLFLNGVKVDFLEEIIGEIPRKRSKIRKAIRRLLHLEFK